MTNRNKQRKGTTTNKVEREKASHTNAPTVTPAPTVPLSDERQGVEPKRPSKEPTTERTFNWERFLTTVGVILVIIQIGIMWRQTTIMERQNDISAQQTQLIEEQTKISEEQSILSQEPQLYVNPTDKVSGDNKRFSLSISNTGISDVKNIRIFRDCFVALKQAGSSLTFYRFGIFTTSADFTIDQIARRAVADFTLDINDVHKEMMDFFTGDQKGYKIMIVRLIIKYRRSLDDKEFSTSKIYLIPYNAPMLLDFDNRGLPEPFDNMVSFDEVKSVLSTAR